VNLRKDHYHEITQRSCTLKTDRVHSKCDVAWHARSGGITNASGGRRGN